MADLKKLFREACKSNPKIKKEIEELLEKHDPGRKEYQRKLLWLLMWFLEKRKISL